MGYTAALCRYGQELETSPQGQGLRVPLVQLQERSRMTTCTLACCSRGACGLLLVIINVLAQGLLLLIIVLLIILNGWPLLQHRDTITNILIGLDDSCCYEGS